MRKTSQDGGDSTSITSGVENEFKKAGILKLKRNSVKRKVQSLSHDHDDGTIEPLLQPESEKTATGNESAKHLSSKLKTDFTSNKGNDMEKLLADKKFDKPTISDIPGITTASYLDNVTETATKKVNYMAPTHNEMHSNVFSSNAGTKELVKSQILVEIDGNKQSIYNPSPLIFTTAKIHTDGNAKYMDLVNVTPVPIVSTIEGKIIKSGSELESNGGITHKIDNTLSKTYAKTVANSIANTGTFVGESSVNKNNSSQSELPPNTKTSLADSVSKLENSGKNFLRNSFEENIVDINKNIETVDKVSINLKSDVSVTNSKISRNPCEVPRHASSQNLTSSNLKNNDRNVSILHTCVSPGTSNSFTTCIPSFVTFTCTPNVSVASKTLVSSATACTTFVTETTNTDIISKTKRPLSSIKTNTTTNLVSSSTFVQTTSSTTINSNFAAKDSPTITKAQSITTVKSVSLSKSIPSTNAGCPTKDSKPFTKQISSSSAVPTQVENKPTTVSNTTAATSINQISKLISSSNTKAFAGQLPNSTPMVSVSVNTSMASSIAKSTPVPTTKCVSTSNAILSNKTPKAIVRKSPSSSAPTTTTASSTGIKTVSNSSKAVTNPNASMNKIKSTTRNGKESTVGSKLETITVPATSNTTLPTRTTITSTTADTSVGTVNPNKPRVANKLTNTKNNDRKDGKGKV